MVRSFFSSICCSTDKALICAGYHPHQVMQTCRSGTQRKYGTHFSVHTAHKCDSSIVATAWPAWGFFSYALLFSSAVNVLNLCQCCGLYYWLWIIVLPKYGNYEIIEEVEESTEGAKNTKLVRRYKNRSVDDEAAPLLAT